MLLLALVLAGMAPETPPATPAIPAIPTEAPAEAPAEVVVARLLERMAAAEQALTDYTATFRRQELVDGTWRDAETMFIKWRRPGDLYMKWLGDGTMGRELLWRPHWKNMKLREGPLTLELALDSWFVTRESRHTVAEAGISVLARVVLADAARAKRYGGVKVELLPARKVHGAPATCWLEVQPKARHPDFYSTRAEMCVDDATGLPIYTKVWNVEDGALRVVEEYSYANLKVNPGLGERDFAPDNPAYRF